MSSFDTYLGIRKQILLLCYVFSVALLGTVFILALGQIPAVTAKLKIVLGIIIAVAGLVGGMFISVVLDLPNISYDFDKIKNDIALKKIDDPRIFGERIVTLLCNFFNFSFFSVKYAFFKIIDSDCAYSDTSIARVISESDLKSILNASKKTEKVSYIGEYAVNHRNLHLYVIPVWFGDEWLGCIGIFTPTKLLKIFNSFLNDFENIYVDDQLIHVLNMKTQLVQKQVYSEINIFSNKVIRREYATLNDYQNDILQFLVNETNCIGGLFVTIYDERWAAYFKDASFNGEYIQELIQKWKQKIKDLPQPRIVTPGNLPFDYVLEIPIIPDDTNGMLFLFDNNEYTLKFLRDFIFEIVNITIHDDLDSLAHQLQLIKS